MVSALKLETSGGMQDSIMNGKKASWRTERVSDQKWVVMRR